MDLLHLVGTRYVMPLREGGSLPAIIDTHPDGQFVVKFRGAGQGPKVLIAETIAAGIAGLIGLPVPRAALVKLGEGFGMGEPDPEIQDLLRGSVGGNFGLEYLPGALGYDLVADAHRVDEDFAAAVVWFDALITNVDRTPRNPNLLVWHDRVWLIDHGASLFFHYGNDDWQSRTGDRFAMTRQHILLPRAGDISEAHARLRPLISEASLRAVLENVPDEWFDGAGAALREAYVAYLLARLDAPGWVEEAESARRQL